MSSVAEYEEKQVIKFIDTLEGEKLTNNISKISFMFVAFLVIAGGYATQVFSCSTQRFLSNNIYGKHVIGIGLIFMFIMLEGGWSFDRKEQEKHSVDWSNGNCIDSMFYALGIYLLFLLSSKTRIFWNSLFFFMLFILYITNTQRLYYFNRGHIKQEVNKYLLHGEKTILYTLPLILLAGVVDYYLYKYKQLGNKFSFYLFFLGNASCTHL